MMKMPNEIVAAANKIAMKKGDIKISKLLVLGFLAGVYISMGGLLSIIAGYGYNGSPAFARLIMGATFPIGLIIIVLAGAELFTGNCAVLIPNVLSGRQSVGSFTKNLSLVWLSNFAGALFFAYFLVYLAGVTSTETIHNSFIAIADSKLANPFHVIFLKGIGANWLVCLAVWLGLSSEQVIGKIAGIWFPIMAFVTIGYEHCIANMFIIPVAILEGDHISFVDMMWRNIIPATLGNIVGGSLFVGTLYWFLYDNKNKELE